MFAVTVIEVKQAGSFKATKVFCETFSFNSKKEAAEYMQETYDWIKPEHIYSEYVSPDGVLESFRVIYPHESEDGFTDYHLINL